MACVHFLPRGSDCDVRCHRSIALMHIRSRGFVPSLKGLLLRIPVILCAVVRERLKEEMAFINPGIAILKTWYGIMEIALRGACAVC